MSRLLSVLRPSLPPVAVLLEPPLGAALRAEKQGRSVNPTATHVGTFFGGPSGELTAEAAEQFARAALPRLGSPKRACLVLGDGFFRTQVLEVSDFPRKEAERIQVLRWHVRKGLDFPVEASRIRYNILRRTDASHSIWVSVARTDDLVAVETAFAAEGCQLGYVGASSTELFNLALAKDMLSAQGATLLLNRTEAGLTFLFAEQGMPLFYRHKEIAGGDAALDPAAGRVAQEIRLTLAFFRERYGSHPVRRVLLRCQPDEAHLPLDEVLTDEEVLRIDRVLAAGQPGAARPAEFLPLYHLMEGL